MEAIIRETPAFHWVIAIGDVLGIVLLGVFFYLLWKYHG